MIIHVDKDIYIALLVPAFAQPLNALTNKNRAYLKKWLAWLDLIQTFDDTQSFIDTAVNQYNNGQGITFAILL